QFSKILSEKHDFSIYTKDIEFVNNWFPDKSYSTVGTMQYAIELAKLKIYVLMRLANSKMTLLKVTNHVEDSSVKIRWRILGISHSKFFLKFFKDNSKNRNGDDDDDLTEWLDGFSTFYVNKKGLVKKHIMERV
ncbi:hypothetical protein HELRODRAFT_136103, partial [Helobdella robusta]|uniref:Uncharacterized protein n=1 Tax=Helobdella robusta TaxID=6412 RepID=T1EIC0_HELRO